MDVPDSQYAVRRDGRSVAYQVFGEGRVDLVFCWGFVSHLDLQWANPDLTRFFEGLASFCRVLVYDKIGTGLSDPIDHVPTLDDRAEDVRAVMDAAGLERAAIFAESESGPTGVVFATMCPERVSSLILFGSIVKGFPTPEEAANMALSQEVMETKWREMDEVLNDWGKGRSLELLGPSIAQNAVWKRAMGTFERASVSPSMAKGIIDIYRQIDVTNILSAVSVPTLILHRAGDWVPVECGRYLADKIPNAKYVELPDDDHILFLGDYRAILDECQQFLTGAVAPAPMDRALLTILFTDIVDSTTRAAQMGDTAWRQLLDRHLDAVRRTLDSLGGRMVKSTGDGVLAVFSTPARAIECATTLVDRLRDLDLDIRAGIHTGECEVLGDDVGGLAVHVGARVAALAGPGEVLVSSTVKDLVIGSGIHFTDRGLHELKGVPQRWQLYAAGDKEHVIKVEPPAAHMTMGDRVTVRLARWAPGAVRAASAFAARGTTR